MYDQTGLLIFLLGVILLLIAFREKLSRLLRPAPPPAAPPPQPAMPPSNIFIWDPVENTVFKGFFDGNVMHRPDHDEIMIVPEGSQQPVLYRVNPSFDDHVLFKDWSPSLGMNVYVLEGKPVQPTPQNPVGEILPSVPGGAQAIKAYLTTRMLEELRRSIMGVREIIGRAREEVAGAEARPEKIPEGVKAPAVKEGAPEEIKEELELEEGGEG